MDVQEPDYGDEYWESEIQYKTCRRCGEGKLHWVDMTLLREVQYGKSKWRLFNESDEMHVCKVDNRAMS